ncbi:uncharacterized protein F5Z01DRAFT_653958 [Emericellopsis atlantica]|uniref:Uncharacterized protein n=1 Tax=Emericellopsis atlantica TaxID=2614577 RepID=A0A9P7ZP52_9HYPO|nr:uncharacterized protein F5Z01DRAFT_653958 [Emericellopsis atlantica]KAG9255093.1 hypothetical protein F5Z01DRAFT_653958 [Emericellopsis atlantica]
MRQVGAASISHVSAIHKPAIISPKERSFLLVLPLVVSLLVYTISEVFVGRCASFSSAPLQVKILQDSSRLSELHLRFHHYGFIQNRESLSREASASHGFFVEAIGPRLHGALLATGSCAQSLLPAKVITQDDSASNIDTAGNGEMAEWLSGVQRAPALTVCPTLCSEAAASGDGWALYPDPASLAACNETMLHQVVFQNEVENGQNTKLAIEACAADFSPTPKAVSFAGEQESVAAVCTTPNHVMLNISVALSSSVPAARAQDSFSTQHLLTAGRQVVNYLAFAEPSCSRNSMSLAYFQSSIIDVFGGAEVHQHHLTAQVLESFIMYAEQKSLAKTTVVQLCAGEERGADYGVGIIAGSAKNFAVVQQAMQSWAEGRCVPVADNKEDWMTVTIRVPKAEAHPANSTDIVIPRDTTSPAHPFSHGAHAHRGGVVLRFSATSLQGARDLDQLHLFLQSHQPRPEWLTTSPRANAPTHSTRLTGSRRSREPSQSFRVCRKPRFAIVSPYLALQLSIQ